jgi:hypothetical protein
MKSFESKGRAHCLAACVTAVLAIGGQSASAQVLATDKVFVANSFWYTPIPLNAPLHPNNGNFVTEFLRQKAAYYNNVNVNTWSYASPVYTIGAGWPTVRVTQWDCQHKGWLDPKLAAQWATVPMPPYVVASSGTDAEMTIYQPSTDTIWEFWRAGKNASGQWLACWGGSMKSASISGGGWGPTYGVTAAGLPFIGGQITAEELTRGEIRHAIGIALVDVERPSIFSWPASRSDGYNPTNVPNRIPEGLRFRLDPTVNVDSLPMTTAGKIIARAAQKYGFVVWDKAGSISIRANNPLTYTTRGMVNPYPALFGGKPSYAVLDGFPWNRLQFLPFNYGKP